MAMHSLGLVDDLTDIKRFIGETKTYQPNPANYEVYRELMPIYIRLSRQIADFQRRHAKG